MNEILMVASSIGMLIVSGFLYWNALRMRKINEENVKIGIWDNRYNVYSGIMDWHDDMLKLLAGIDPPQANYELLSKCNFHELEKYIRKTKLLFMGNNKLTSFLSQYEDSASNIFVSIYFKQREPEDIYNDALKFAEWFLEEEDNFFEMLCEYLVLE